MEKDVLLKIVRLRETLKIQHETLRDLCQTALDQGESVVDVADAAGVTRATIYKWVEVGAGPEMVDVRDYLNMILLLLSSTARDGVGRQEAAKALGSGKNTIKMSRIRQGFKGGWWHIDMLAESERRECIKAMGLISKLENHQNPDSVSRTSIPTI